MDTKKWYIEKMMERTVMALKENYFDAAFFINRKDLLEKVMGYVKPKMKIGIGGSVTLREMGLVEKLKKEKVTVLDHWEAGLQKEEIQAMRVQHLTSDLFLSGSNAITENGEIVNIDGVGNRVSSITFGPKKVIIVAGYNKIVPDVEAAIDRIKDVAAPMNAKRLNLPLPCAKTGYCHDCKSEQRICRIVSILEKRPAGTDISVFIMNEALGL
ncbi:MAG TPA: lactate utilization protein [Syntrophorhabdaceae bacterium]|nr:lactate utilization protein [Syntrophorhabdaceae bacterium]HQM81487.1 lactate utilization protein [Syntrophorhabdaceae bacterium]